MTATFLASLGHVLWRTANAHGVDAAGLFAHAGLDPQIIEGSRARVPFHKLCRGWSELASVTGIAHLGLEGAIHCRPSDLHAIGMSFLASANLLDALCRMDRYETILDTHLDFEIVQKPSRVEFLFESHSVPEHSSRVMSDLRSAVVVALARKGLDRDVKLLEAGFTYRGPADTRPYREFFKSPVQFSSPSTYIAFDIRDCRTPFTARNIDLVRESDQILDRLLSTVEDQDIVSRAKRYICTHLLSGNLSEATVAKSLHVSQRTLHRRLSEKNTSFRGILNDARRELAEGYLQQTMMPVTEISYLVGFSDVSSFSRAYKKWTGHSPTAFRDLGGLNQKSGERRQGDLGLLP